MYFYKLGFVLRVIYLSTLEWGRMSVYSVWNRLLRLTTKKTSKQLCICERIPPSNLESVSMWWRHHNSAGILARRLLATDTPMFECLWNDWRTIFTIVVLYGMAYYGEAPFTCTVSCKYIIHRWKINDTTWKETNTVGRSLIASLVPCMSRW